MPSCELQLHLHLLPARLQLASGTAPWTAPLLKLVRPGCDSTPTRTHVWPKTLTPRLRRLRGSWREGGRAESWTAQSIRPHTHGSLSCVTSEALALHADCGVDGVKVDVQGTVGMCGKGFGGGAALSRRFHDALEDSVQQHFPGNHMINCMCHDTQDLYRYQDPTDSCSPCPSTNMPAVNAGLQISTESGLDQEKL